MFSRLYENSCVRKKKHAYSSSGIHRDKETLFCLALLKSCASKKDLHEGIKIHDMVVKKRLLEKSSYVGNSVVNMYVKCGAMLKAEQVFQELPIRNVVTWNSLISGYIHQGLFQSAFNCFILMQSDDGIFPNAITFTYILKACGSVRDVEKGIQVHEMIVRRGLLEKDIVLGNALVDMYVKCGLLAKAQRVLQELPVRDVVSWNIMINGCVQNEQNNKALSIYERMQSEDLAPNSITFILILKACSNIGLIEKGENFMKVCEYVQVYLVVYL